MSINQNLLERCSKALFEKIFFCIDNNKYNWDVVPEAVRQGFRDEALTVIKEYIKMELIINPTECPLCGEESGVVPALEIISKDFTCKSCGGDIHVDYHIHYKEKGEISDSSFWLSGGKVDD